MNKQEKIIKNSKQKNYCYLLEYTKYLIE